MTTPEMEIALMSFLGIRQNIIVPNVSWSFLDYEADLVVLSKNNYATEIEIKISKSDLKKDKDKNHNHCSKYFKYLYFAVPSHLLEFALTEVPEKAGIYEVVGENGDYWVRKIRSPAKNKDSLQWLEGDRNYLAELGCMRILGLKKKVQKYKEK